MKLGFAHVHDDGKIDQVSVDLTTGPNAELLAMLDEFKVKLCAFGIVANPTGSRITAMVYQQGERTLLSLMSMTGEAGGVISVKEAPTAPLDEAIADIQQGMEKTATEFNTTSQFHIFHDNEEALWCMALLADDRKEFDA